MLILELHGTGSSSKILIGGTGTGTDIISMNLDNTVWDANGSRTTMALGLVYKVVGPFKRA